MHIVYRPDMPCRGVWSLFNVGIDRYLQYDDWFYKSVGPSDYGAVVTWDALPSVFPHGIQ